MNGDIFSTILATNLLVLVYHIILSLLLVLRSPEQKKQRVFNESEFEAFLRYQGVITNYLYCNSELANPIDCGNCVLEFQQLPVCKVVKILKDNSFVFLAYDSVCNLWNVLPLKV